MPILYLLIYPDGTGLFCNPYQSPLPDTVKMALEVPDSLNWNGDENVLYYMENEFRIQPPPPDDGGLYAWCPSLEKYFRYG